MKIHTLKNHLKNILLFASTPVEECHLESGLHFLCPPPASATDYMVFAGTIEDWEILQKKTAPKRSCTYLIYCSSDTIPQDIICPPDCNILFLNCTSSQLISLLCSLLEMQKETTSALEKQYTSFWTNIQNRHFSSHAEVLAELQHFSYPLGEYISCLLIRPDAIFRSQAHPESITELLRKEFPHTNVFQWETEWIALFSFDDPAIFFSQLQTDSCESFLMQHHLIAAVSHPTREFHTLQMLYFTANAALTLGLQMHFGSGNRLFTYTEYSPYYLIHLSYQELINRTDQDNLLYLAHPDIVKLYLYDLEHHSDLLPVLSAYLKYGHNLGQTAGKLYMHRNTLLNRLNKIKKMCTLNLEDSQNHFILQLSCMLVDYYCNFARRSV